MKSHIAFIENSLEANGEGSDWRALSEFNLMQIGFFQHERTIHLLVTLFFGLMLMLSSVSGLILMNFWLLVVGVITLVMTGLYIRHYFILENGVQKLYSLEKEILKRFERSIEG
ncbi:MAG: hypothetical protein WC552_10010 [Candidatus Omnitrophota bacterium]